MGRRAVLGRRVAYCPFSRRDNRGITGVHPIRSNGWAQTVDGCRVKGAGGRVKEAARDGRLWACRCYGLLPLLGAGGPKKPTLAEGAGCISSSSLIIIYIYNFGADGERCRRRPSGFLFGGCFVGFLAWRAQSGQKRPGSVHPSHNRLRSIDAVINHCAHNVHTLLAHHRPVSARATQRPPFDHRRFLLLFAFCCCAVRHAPLAFTERALVRTGCSRALS